MLADVSLFIPNEEINGSLSVGDNFKGIFRVYLQESLPRKYKDHI
jgi:hypothetical protein